MKTPPGVRLSAVHSRRDFLRTSGAALAGATLLPVADALAAVDPVARPQPIRLGVITDLHHGFQPDALSRLEAFRRQVEAEPPALLLQLGDFCHPRPDARECLRLWEGFKGPRYHVLGNHDMDHATKRQTMDFWGMPEPHYSFEAGGFHCVVLDCNFLLRDGRHVDYANSNYYLDRELRDRISPEQVEWLRSDLAATRRPTVIFSHQALDEIWDGGAVPNRLAVRAVIREANARARERNGAPQVIACFCGHHHLDSASVIEGVHYVQVNSASYYWAGGKLGSDGPRAVYAQPLFAFVTLDPAGEIRVQGRRGEFQRPTPTETGHPEAARLSASITDRTLKFVAVPA